MVDASKLADKLGSPAILSQNVLLALLEFNGESAANPMDGRMHAVEDWQSCSDQMDWKIWTPLTFAFSLTRK